MKIVATLLDVLCTFNEVFWLYQLVGVFLESKDYFFNKKINCQLIKYLAHAIYILSVISLNHIELTSAYTMVVIMVLNILWVVCFWKCDFTQVFAVVGGYFFAMFLEGNIVISITGVIGGEELIRKCTGEQGITRVLYLLINGLVWYILNKYIIRMLKKRPLKSYSLIYMAGVSILGFVGSAFIGTMLVDSFSIRVGIIWHIFLVIILLIIFVGYFVMKQKEAQLRMTILNSKNEMLEKNYMQVNKFYTTNAKLYHDMNHHFNAIYYMLQHGESQEAQRYIEGLRESNHPAQIKTQSGINVLDAVLYEMERKAEEKGVLFTIEMPMLSLDLGIVNSDMCSLFANLLENALEAASREVVLKVKEINQALLLVVQNDYTVEPIKKEKHFLTSKKEKDVHGWGTQIVEGIVQKYEGNLEYDTKNGIFRVEILLNKK